MGGGLQAAGARGGVDPPPPHHPAPRPPRSAQAMETRQLAREAQQRLNDFISQLRNQTTVDLSGECRVCGWRCESVEGGGAAARSRRHARLPACLHACMHAFACARAPARAPHQSAAAARSQEPGGRGLCLHNRFAVLQRPVRALGRQQQRGGGGGNLGGRRGASAGAHGRGRSRSQLPHRAPTPPNPRPRRSCAAADFSKNGIGAAGVAQLCQALEHNSVLTTVMLDTNNAGGWSVCV